MVNAFEITLNFCLTLILYVFSLSFHVDNILSTLGVHRLMTTLIDNKYGSSTLDPGFTVNSTSTTSDGTYEPCHLHSGPSDFLMDSANFSNCSDECTWTYKLHTRRNECSNSASGRWHTTTVTTVSAVHHLFCLQSVCCLATMLTMTYPWLLLSLGLT